MYPSRAAGSSRGHARSQGVGAASGPTPGRSVADRRVPATGDTAMFQGLRTHLARDGEIHAGCSSAAPWSPRERADTDAQEVSHRTPILEA